MSLWQRIIKRVGTFKARTIFKTKTLMSDRKRVFKWIVVINTAGFAIALATADNLEQIKSHQLLRWANMWLPPFLRSPIYTYYAKQYDLNLQEVELPLHQYSTFSDFFTRRINRQAPQEQPNTVCSPCDGKVLSYQEVTEDKCHIIKGHKYSLTQLMMGDLKGQQTEPIHTYIRKNKNNKLYQVIIYLGPGDYHRFHAPTDMTKLKEKEIQGGRKRVNQETIMKGEKIYEENSRICMFNQWKQGVLAMVLVGALNVSKIMLANKTIFKRADEVGYFSLGSTIVMLVESKGVKEWRVKEGEKVKYGQPLLEYLP